MPPVDGASGTTSSKAKTAASVSARSFALARIRPGVGLGCRAVVMENPALPPRAWRVPRGVLCTDISPGLLAFARERTREAGLDNVEFVEADAEQLDFEEGELRRDRQPGATYVPARRSKDADAPALIPEAKRPSCGECVGRQEQGPVRHGRLDNRRRTRPAATTTRAARDLCASRSASSREVGTGGRLSGCGDRHHGGDLRDRDTCAIHGIHS